MGTDLNRNWGFHFADGGSSYDPCSQVYHGSGPFSEVENRNVRDFVWAHKVYTRARIARIEKLNRTVFDMLNFFSKFRMKLSFSIMSTRILK